MHTVHAYIQTVGVDLNKEVDYFSIVYAECGEQKGLVVGLGIQLEELHFDHPELFFKYYIIAKSRTYTV